LAFTISAPLEKSSMLRRMKGLVVVFRGLVLFSGLLLAGCGGSDDHTGSTPPAQTECQAVMNEYCSSATSCLVTGNVITEADRATTNQSCIDEGAVKLPCDHAVGVSSTYDQCLTDLKSLPCEPVVAVAHGMMVDPLPISCNQVILIRP